MVLKYSTMLGDVRLQPAENPHVFSTAALRATLEKGFSAAC
jgi:hypothetical protein